MTKEIIVNAGEMESRVAILENGRLMELHIEREPKIVGNIYKGRVTKVLKGMDAAFVDIGVERNAFLSVSDVVPQDDEGEESSSGRLNRRNLPPITQLLHGNQDLLVQVVRAPMGTKGARITTRLSLPGRYMVLMLNSGSYIGVSRKIEDPKERQRLRALATSLRPDGYSLIVRTEAEGKSEDELRGDMNFLLDLAHRTEAKANHVSPPALVHGDLTLIFRLIRDAFTRDVSRVVVDSPSAYEGVVELVEMLSPDLKNRIFLYDEDMPIFHAYNIEPEIERTLRRKVWLPSGGSLIVDQAEALTAIDVNTGRFVGSVELAETVLTTNLQAAEEVARQLRLRDLGGIIVVDFIDMDNPRHRQQVTRAFEEALRRDRAKLKVHSISPLGLVEMTRKRTGESISTLLTEPCPYCSGIGRVQNALTMAMRIQRDLAAGAVEHPNTEAFLVTAHPRVIANVLGFEGEVHHDLEQYLGHPVYLRVDEHYHPNTYRLERLTLEQALAAVSHLEEEEIIEGQVVNPDPDLSLSPLLHARGLFVVVPELDAPVGARVRVCIKQTGTSLAIAEPLAAELRTIRSDAHPMAISRPSLVPESLLPSYLREELAAQPPAGLPLLSPTAEALENVGEDELITPLDNIRDRDRRKGRRKPRQPFESATDAPAIPPPNAADEPMTLIEHQPVETGIAEVVTPLEPALSETAVPARRRRRRRRSAKQEETLPIATAGGVEGALDSEPVEAIDGEEPIVTAALVTDPVPVTEEGGGPARSRRRRRGGARHRRHRRPDEMLEVAPLEPILEEISPEDAAAALLSMLDAIPGPPGEAVETVAEAVSHMEALAAGIAGEAPIMSITSEEEVLTAAALVAGEIPPRRRTRAPRPRRPRAAEATSEQETLPVPTPVSDLKPEPEHPPIVEELPVPGLDAQPTPEESPTPRRRRAPRRRPTVENPPEIGDEG